MTFDLDMVIMLAMRSRALNAHDLEPADQSLSEVYPFKWLEIGTCELAGG
jgi:hypothetical protein